MPVIDPDKVSALIVECADRFIMPRFKKLKEHEISTKSGPEDFVTHADLDVEAHLSAILPEMAPGSHFIGEEGVSSGRVTLDILQDKEAAVWVADPVDGTYNFTHGRPEFGVILAFIKNGRTQAGWIYDIPGKRMAVAERGAGAFADDGRLQTARGADPQDLKGFVSPRFFPKRYRDTIMQAQSRFNNCVSIRSAAHEYLRIARGEAHFSVYSRAKPWDHLAGALMVEEAGGRVAAWDGQPYGPADNPAGLIAAAGSEAWDIAHQAFVEPL